MIRIVAKDLKLHVTQGIKMVPRKSKGRGEESLLYSNNRLKRNIPLAEALFPSYDWLRSLN